MRQKLRLIGCGLTLALATSGCTPLGHHITELDTKPKLEAWGPGTVFPNIENAAVDALLYAYRQALDENDLQRMRGGTIYPVDGGYTYGEVHVASGLQEHRISYPLKPRDVARFHIYPLVISHDVNRRNKWISQADRRSVAMTDPLHRPLFILHPSLVVREYRGRDAAVAAHGNLGHSKRVILIAGE